MRIITFYSFKGGVGRTLTCANFGMYLAKAGQKVVLADMDLEAPGLDSKFFPDTETQISNGLVDQIMAFQQGLPLPSLSPIPITRLPEEVTRSGGRLQLIPAGNYSAPDKYHGALSQLDWDFLLNEHGLTFWLGLLSRIENELKPDVLVIDSRTGYTEIGGLCTQILPDTVLLFTSTSPESMKGTKVIFERIQNSPLIRSRVGRKTSVDMRVVITRVPRPPDVESFDQEMKQRLNLEVPQLYYLFEEGELATREYLAMDRISADSPSIQGDYVQLFESLNPEDTHGYVVSRLDSFNRELMLRDEAENRREIQELLTLFPRAQVYLTAARFYRFVKDTEKSIMNYMDYLERNAGHKEVILEFAKVCAGAPQGALTDRRETVVRHLATLGPNVMDPSTLSLYCTLAKSPEQLQAIVESIEGDPTKLSAPQFRSVLFRALSELHQWDKLVASVTDSDLKDVAVQRIVAKAYAKLHAPDKALKIIHRLPLRDPTEVLPIMEILYDLRADANSNDIRKAIQENRHLSSYLRRYSASFLEQPTLSAREDGGFRSWISELLTEKKLSQ